MEQLTVPELAKLGTKAKSAFTRATNDLDLKLDTGLTMLDFAEI